MRSVSPSVRVTVPRGMFVAVSASGKLNTSEPAGSRTLAWSDWQATAPSMAAAPTAASSADLRM
jgi:hypothetical protein